LNLAENHQPVIELYQTADHPTLSPKSGSPEWRVATAGEFGGFWITMWKTRGKYLPFDWGSLYRSTGQNINGPNINELQINCSIGQQKPVDV
jgi:hypothetical protein